MLCNLKISTVCFCYTWYSQVSYNYQGRRFCWQFDNPQHVVCRQHFHKDVRKQLYSDADDRNFFNRIKDALKHVESRLEEGRVALQVSMDLYRMLLQL